MTEAGDATLPAILVVKTFIPSTAQWAIGTDRRPIWFRIDGRPIRLDPGADLRIELAPGTHDLMAAPSSGVTHTPTRRQWARLSQRLQTEINAGQTAIVVVIATQLGLKIGAVTRCR